MSIESFTHNGIDRSSRRDTFIVVQGIEVEVQDFVAIFNGEECLPVLSKTEMLTEILRKYPLMDRLPDEVNLHNRSGDIDKPRLRKQKLLKLQKIIKREKMESGFTQIEMDRVLAMLSPENMRFDNVVEFVARYAEPKVSEAEVVMASVSAVNEGLEGNLQCHYLTDHNVRPISNMDAVTLEKIMNYLGINLPESYIPVIMIERVLAGFVLSNDEKKKLSIKSNISDSSPNAVIRNIKELIMGAGVLVVCIGTPPFGIVSTQEEMMNFIFSGSALIGVGMLSRLIQTNSIKLKIKSSIKKYEKVEKELQKAVNVLKNSPSGRVRLAILWEIVQHCLSNEQALSREKLYDFEESFQGFETRARLMLNHRILYDFSVFLDSSFDNELSFNEMMAGRELNTRQQILDAIVDFKQTISEMEEISTLESKEIQEQVAEVYEEQTS